MRFANSSFILAGVMGAVLFSAGAAQAAPPVCLSTRQIESSKPSDDGRSITFTMKNGAVWQNKLQSPCPDLAFNGFSWVLHDPSQQACEDTQTLRVLQTQQVCNLGKFTQVKPPIPGKASGF